MHAECKFSISLKTSAVTRINAIHNCYRSSILIYNSINAIWKRQLLLRYCVHTVRWTKTYFAWFRYSVTDLNNFALAQLCIRQLWAAERWYNGIHAPHAQWAFRKGPNESYEIKTSWPQSSHMDTNARVKRNILFRESHEIVHYPVPLKYTAL